MVSNHSITTYGNAHNNRTDVIDSPCVRLARGLIWCDKTYKDGQNQ